MVLESLSSSINSSHASQLSHEFQASQSSTPAIQECPPQVIDHAKGPHWVHQYYTIYLESDGKKRRRCSHKGCNKSYHYLASHQNLRRHTEKHGLLNQRTSFTFSDTHTTDKIIKWIIKDRKSYCSVESEAFKEMMLAANPTMILPSRASVSSAIINRTTQIQSMVKDKLAEASSIALTFDMWTSSHGHGYGGLQAHFFNQAGTLETVTLEFKRVLYPHDGPAINNFLETSVKSFGIEKKIIAITTDSASNNMAAIELLDISLELDLNFKFGFAHFRCVSHILNLAVNKSLDILKPLVLSVRTFVLSIRSSPKRTEKFDSLQQEVHQEKLNSAVGLAAAAHNFNTLQLIEDVPTRWNSTYRMLERAHRLRESIDMALLVMADLKDHNQINWELVKQLVDFLEPFNEMTEDLSGEKYPTLPLVNAYIPALIEHLKENNFTHPEINDAATAALKKLEDYGKHLDQPVASIATMLDPRFKLEPIDAAVRTHAQNALERCIDRTSEPTRACPSTSRFKRIWSEPAPDEITAYLGTKPEPKGCDVALYWKTNETNYPNLAKLAHTLLNIQATSVACERIFSRAGLVDSHLRSQLSDESFRSNMLLNSWLKFLNIS